MRLAAMIALLLIVGLFSVGTQQPAPLMEAYPALVYDAQPAPPLPSLVSFLRGNDRDTAHQVQRWFEAHRDELAALWGETDDTRLLGWYVMMLVHLSAPYGESRFPVDLRDFMRLPAAHCGTYTSAQALLLEHLSVEYRFLEFADGTHGWVEMRINGHWELFDATTAVWVSEPMETLLQGAAREFRAFYSPITDAARPDYRTLIFDSGGDYNVALLRERIACTGLCWQPSAAIVEHPL